MILTLVTDVPVWVRPLAQALEDAGVDCRIASEPHEVPGDGWIVNRLSCRILVRDPQRARAFGDALQRWQNDGRGIVNGPECYRIGLSKLEQFRHFQRCGVATPLTHAAIPGGRAMPDRRVLIKPPAGGFGKGIVALEAGLPAPADLFGAEEGWVEQEHITPADGWVHRVEFLGPEILYEARSPYQPDDFNYCLAKAGEDVELVGAEDLPPAVVAAAQHVAQCGDLRLGALEYFIDAAGTPVFFDFNPVSSLHPRAAALLGCDPWKRIAEALVAAPGLGGSSA